MFLARNPRRLDLVESREGAVDRARRRAHFLAADGIYHLAFVASRRARRARVSFSPRRLPFGRAYSRADPRDARRPSPPERLSPPRRADRDAALFPRDGIQKRKTKSALSLDAFSRAKRSTYDKRVVLEKRRNLAAAKVNKYRKIEKRLGKSVEVTDAFDPEKYAARLDALERD